MVLRAAILFLALVLCPNTARAALPLVEVAATERADAPDFFVVWISGDGGWGKLEKQVTRRLAAEGVPTLGISSARYYIVPRKPADTAAALGAIIPDYAARWGKTRFVLAGFSFGAASGPFVVQALAPAMREKLALAAFLSPGARANFWAGPWSWFGIGVGPKVSPVLRGLAPTPVLCIGGAGIFEDVCPRKSLPGIISVEMPGGHLLTDQYDEIAQLILANAQAARPPLALAPNPPAL